MSTFTVSGRRITSDDKHVILMVQNDRATETVNLLFNTAEHGSLTTLAASIHWINANGQGDWEEPTVAAVTGGFKVSWVPSAAASSVAGPFAFNVCFSDENNTIVWHTYAFETAIAKDVLFEPVGYPVGNLADALLSMNSHMANTGIHVTAQNKADWNAKLGDAPSDNKQYARKNGTWAEVTGGGGGGTYTEGTGIDIANNTISVENDVARNVSTGVGSFVEHRCSASQDRTFGNATAYGVNARANTAATSMGSGANSASAGIAVGYTATAAANATSVGYNANAYQNGTALGYNALATNNYGTALGRSAESHGNYGIAVGFQATLGTNSSEIAIGKDSKAQGLCSVAIGSAYEYGSNGAEATQSNSIAIGAGAKADAYNAIQIGAGTNSNSNTFQITNFPILTPNGKFYEQRMPYGLQYATELPFSLYSANENQSYGMLYTGATNAVYTNKSAYFSKALWGNSRAWCSWVNGDFVSDENQDRIMVNQATFYDKMKDWGYSGGGNSSQCVYFYYDADSEEWRAQLNDDTIEDHSCGQELTDIDLADFGITTVGITLPTSGEEEIFDIDYYAPFYFDNYDYDGDAFTVDYQVFIEQMEDGDWGFDCIEVEGEYYPNISDEGSTIRFEYDSSGPGTWKEYLDEEYCGYEWETPQMASTFGITIEEGEEESVDHIEITLYPSTRRYWKAEASSYYTKPATGIPKTDLASDVQTSLGKADTALQGHQAIKRINGQPMTGSGDLNIAEVVTTAPTADAPSVGIHIAILSSAPATEYANWIYLIQEA